MNTKSRIYSTIVAITLILILTPIDLSSQPIWINQGHQKGLSWEILKPKFDRDNTNFASSVHFVTLRWPLSEKLLFVGEVPFAYAKRDQSSLSADTKLGNPYLGIELNQEDFPLFWEIGVRLPLVGSDNFASFVGFFADVDRFEALNPDLITLLALVNWREKNSSNIFFRLRGGTSLFLNTEDKDNSEWFLIFNGFVGYDNDKVKLEGGLTGRFIFTDDRVLGRTFLQAGANLSVTLGKFRPGIHFRLPIEKDLREVLEFVYGLGLEFRFE